jgi:hypothetical protein
MVTMDNKATPNTTMFPLRERLFHSVATPRTILRSERSRNSPDSTASVCSFAFECRKESSPRCVTDRFSQMMILEQSFDVQIFNRYLIKLANQIKAGLMKEILTLIGYLQMFLAKQVDSLFSICAAALFLAHQSLANLQGVFGFAKVARILYHFACRESGIVFESNIYANAITGLRKEARLIFFNREKDKPAVNLLLDGASLDFAFNFARQTKSDRANLGERQLVTFEFESRLRIGEGVEKPFAFKSWIARCVTSFEATKESVKGFIESLQSVLQNLRVNASGVFAVATDFRQLILLTLIIDRGLGDFVGIASLLQRGIVKFSAKIKRLLELMSNSLRWFEFEFIGFDRLIIAFFLSN